jgi:hypothetical protein
MSFSIFQNGSKIYGFNPHRELWMVIHATKAFEPEASANGLNKKHTDRYMPSEITDVELT